MKSKLTIAIFVVLTLFSCTKKTVDDGVQVTNITLSEESLNLEIGAEAKLTYIIEPMDATDLSVTWKSMNEAIATVDQSGVVTAIAPGQTNVILQSVSGVYDVCSVTVNESTVFDRLVGHWKGCRVEWVDNVNGEVYQEDQLLEIVPNIGDPAGTIQLNRDLYCFDLKKDSTMNIGCLRDLSEDRQYFYAPGVFKETTTVNMYHGSFNLEGTSLEYLDYLKEVDFKYIEDENLVRIQIHESDMDRYDLGVYFEIIKEEE